jgi:hypothetical protein
MADFFLKYLLAVITYMRKNLRRFEEPDLLYPDQRRGLAPQLLQPVILPHGAIESVIHGIMGRH